MFDGAYNRNWDLTLYHADPPSDDFGSMDVGDIDGDGEKEIVCAGYGAMLWYKPSTGEYHIIAKGSFNVGTTLYDVDGDGKPEVVVSRAIDGKKYQERFALVYYKPGDDITAPWQEFLIDPVTPGGCHDIVFTDIDNDGVDEIIGVAIGLAKAIWIFKAGDDVTQPWQKHLVQDVKFCEGASIGDVDGDGQKEIICGPHLFKAPAEGPYAGQWSHSVAAPNFREMCRTALVDITGNGRLDLVIAESEFYEGRLSWFENTPGDNGTVKWVEHPMDWPLYYTHSLTVWQDNGQTRIFAGEMAAGGWSAPRNYDAKLIEYTTADKGKSWQREVAYQGEGTHEAMAVDIDNDREIEFVGKQWQNATVQIYKRSKEASPILDFRHEFIDRDKPETAIDIIPADLTGSGCDDVICGSWWYEAPTWQRYDIPGICQVIAAHDIDGDGKLELIAMKRKGDAQGYGGLCSDLVWLKAIDPRAGKWEEYPIGTGVGDWPHGCAVAPVLPGGKLALMTSYHSAHSSAEEGQNHYPDLWEIPDDPTTGPWPRRPLTEIVYGEELIPCDLTGNGTLDIAAGLWWLENNGDGTFTPHTIVDGLYPARLAVMDVTGNGKLDVVLGEEGLDFENQVTPFTRLAWFENPGEVTDQPWNMHVIDKVRCGHSVGAADLDGDGELEIVCGEHDPFKPYRHRCRLYVYKKALKNGKAWKRYTLDDRFEHHVGTKIINLGGGKQGIISHGWKDVRYVNLWRIP